MRIAILSLDDPWLQTDGGTLRTRAVAEACRDLGHEVSVVFAGAAARAGGREAQVEGVTLVPVAQPPAGERRLPARAGALKRRFLPLPTVRGAAIPSLRRALAGRAPLGLLYVSQIRAAQYHRVVPGARLWLDQADLWSDVAAREVIRRRALTRATAGAQRRWLGSLEARWARRACAVSTAGHRDAMLLAARVPESSVSWLPTPVASPAPEPNPPTGLAVPERTLGLLANFAYAPNRDAYDLLRTTWAPALARAGGTGWRFLVAGPHSETLAPAPGVERLGSLDSPAELYSRVDGTVAPIRFGGGIKVKVIESLVHERPVLATPHAVAGLDERFRRRIPTVDPERPDFSFLATGLPRDPDLFALAREEFSPQRFRVRVEELLQRCDCAAAAR